MMFVKVCLLGAEQLMRTLTPSQVHYIKSVYELSSKSCNGRVCIVDIADKLGVTKMEKEGLMGKDDRRQVFMTSRGEKLAVSMIYKNTVIQDFLIEVLSVNKEIAAADACAIEHVISGDTPCALCRYLTLTNPERQCMDGRHVPKSHYKEQVVTTNQKAMGKLS